MRAMLRNHRGLSELRRVKAVFWWCYMHTECPKGAAEVLRSMPTDEDIDLLYELYSGGRRAATGPRGATGRCGRSSTIRHRALIT